MIKRNRTALTNIFTTMRQTSTAEIRNHMSRFRTFITGDIDDLDDLIGIFGNAIDSDLNTLGQNGALLINTAAHCRFLAGNELCGNVHNVLEKLIIPCKTGYLAQYFIFKVLDLSIEFTHFLPPA